MFPRATMREVALALCVVDELLCDHKDIDAAVEWSRNLFDTIERDEIWRGGRHQGDCTKDAFTCARCLVEGYEQKAVDLATAEGFDVFGW